MKCVGNNNLSTWVVLVILDCLLFLFCVYVTELFFENRDFHLSNVKQKETKRKVRVIAYPLGFCAMLRVLWGLPEGFWVCSCMLGLIRIGRLCRILLVFCIRRIFLGIRRFHICLLGCFYHVA